MPNLWFHDLRRSLVTKVRRQGIPESVVMRLSGHRTHAAFERYNIVEEDDLRAAVKPLEPARSQIGGPTDGKSPAEALPKDRSLSS